MNKKCQGCGTILQDQNHEQLGFVPPSKFNDAIYCERCYKIIHYSQKQVTLLPNINNYIIETINKKAKYVFFLIDFLNINSETINTFKNIHVPKTLIISKIDIIPKSIKKETITNWLEKNYCLKEDIIFQSTKKNFNTKFITKYLEEHHLKECYVLGFTNSGKSSLINKISKLNNNQNSIITTSSIPNTTIDFIKIPLTPSLSIIDSPGFTYQSTIYQPDDFNLISRINPSKTLNPITYQTKDNTSILVENLIRITPNSHNSLTFYLSNDLKLERIFDDKKLLPYSQLEIKIEDNSDIVIKSLGFINIKKACTLKIQINNPSLIEIRPSLFNRAGE